MRYVPLAAPVDSAYSRRARLFPDHHPDLPLYCRFFLIVSLFL